MTFKVTAMQSDLHCPIPAWWLCSRRIALPNLSAPGLAFWHAALVLPNSKLSRSLGKESSHCMSHALSAPCCTQPLDAHLQPAESEVRHEFYLTLDYLGFRALLPTRSARHRQAPSSASVNESCEAPKLLKPEPSEHPSQYPLS